MDDSNFDMENSSLVDVRLLWKRILDSYRNKLLCKFSITVRPFHARVQSSTCKNYGKCNNCRLTKLVIQLTAFIAFETSRKLNFVCCNHVHFSHQPLVMSLKRKVLSSLLSKNSHTMDRFIIFMHTNQEQIFDDDTDYKRYVKNLLRFFSNNIANERTDKKFKEFYYIGLLKILII